MIYKRVTLLCGHYGSGKTNVAVNMAYDQKAKYEKVAIADLDIVNPYFRTKDSADEFEKQGIELICSEYAGSNVDIPALPQDRTVPAPRQFSEPELFYWILNIGRYCPFRLQSLS